MPAPESSPPDLSTAEAVRAAPAGRGLDAAVAERVEGWLHVAWQTWCGYPPGKQDGAEPYTWPARIGAQPVPPYSTSDAAALAMLERLYKGRNWDYQIKRTVLGVEVLVRPKWNVYAIASAPTLALAACRAALLAGVADTEGRR